MKFKKIKQNLCFFVRYIAEINESKGEIIFSGNMFFNMKKFTTDLNEICKNFNVNTVIITIYYHDYDAIGSANYVPSTDETDSNLNSINEWKRKHEAMKKLREYYQQLKNVILSPMN